MVVVDDVDIVEALEAPTIGVYPCFANSLKAWIASRLEYPMYCLDTK